VSDDTGLNGYTAADPEGSPRPFTTPADGGFFASTAGRVLLVGGGVIILLGIVGAVVFFVLGSSLLGVSSGASAASAPTAVATPASPVGSAASSSSVGAPAIPTIANRDVFTPRSPFVPIVPAVTVTAAEASATQATNDNTVILTDIVINNGVRNAVFLTQGVTYTLAVGGTIGSTPWKVISIGTSSVVMQFGDTRVTFSLGQGITK
jgi:hypothetical protein